MSLRVRLSRYCCAFQEYLFPTIEADLGPLGERYQLLITVLEFVQGANSICTCFRTLRGRPQQDQPAPARTSMAKAVFQIDTTSVLSVNGCAKRTWRCAACPAGIVYGRSPARRPSRVPLPGSLRAPCTSRLHEALIANTVAAAVGRSCVDAMRRRLEWAGVKATPKSGQRSDAE